jgi:hypothetical protein
MVTHNNMATENNMDSDEGSKQEKTGSIVANDGDIPLPTWVRCGILYGTRNSWVLLGEYYRFLCFISTILWSIFFITR